jgi:hypothetical protein
MADERFRRYATPARALVAIGDSITDGMRSTPNANRRWPDALARRLTQKGIDGTAVVNAGISGNRLLSGSPCYGDALLNRFDRDALRQPGVRAVILLRLASWWGNGSPRRRRVAGLRGRSATLGLRHGPDSYGRQQWGILDNGRKPDPATPREDEGLRVVKPLSWGTIMTVPEEEAPANFVPAAAVIRRVQALFGITGRKGCVGGL